MEIVAALVVLCVLGVALLALGAWMFFRNPWLDDPEPPPWLDGYAGGRLVECVCGRQIAAGGPAHHLVAEAFTDDAALAGGHVAGGTGAVADFCPDDCPGGCNRGCVKAQP